LYFINKRQALNIPCNSNEWKKNKVPDEIKLLVFNFVMTKCNLKALQLEEEFSLPPHIPLPKLTPESERKETKANYAG
jgi:hypothetical protein